MKKRKSIYIYLVIILLLITSISIFSLNIYSKNILDKEVKSLLKKDISKDKYTINTKSLFKYSKVEKAIKEYMKDYSDNIKKANDIINDETIKVILSSSNYKNDGPKFEKSLKLLEDKQKEFTNIINKLLKMTDEKEIMKYINDYNLSDKYVEVYKKYMFGKEYNKDIENNKNIIKKINDTGLNIINTDNAVLKMLKDNSDKWVIKEESIYFYSNDLLQQYNNLVQNLQK